MGDQRLSESFLYDKRHIFTNARLILDTLQPK